MDKWINRLLDVKMDERRCFCSFVCYDIVIFLVNFRHYTLQKGSSLYYLPNACSFQRIPDLLVIFFSDEVRLMIIEFVAMFYQFMV